jgi:hypothetical protein
MSSSEISRRGALKYFGLLAASAAGREFWASWLPAVPAHADGQHHLMTIQERFSGVYAPGAAELIFSGNDDLGLGVNFALCFEVI